MLFTYTIPSLKVLSKSFRPPLEHKINTEGNWCLCEDNSAAPCLLSWLHPAVVQLLYSSLSLSIHLTCSQESGLRTETWLRSQTHLIILTRTHVTPQNLELQTNQIIYFFQVSWLMSPRHPTELSTGCGLTEQRWPSPLAKKLAPLLSGPGSYNINNPVSAY